MSRSMPSGFTRPSIERAGAVVVPAGERQFEVRHLSLCLLTEARSAAARARRALSNPITCRRPRHVVDARLRRA